MHELKGRKLGEILVALGIITEEGAHEAIEYAMAWGVRFGQACVELGLVKEERQITHALALQMGVPAVSLTQFKITPEVAGLVTGHFAATRRVLPLLLTQHPMGGRNGLVVALADPRNLSALDEVAFKTGCRITTVVTSDAELDAALVRFYQVDPTTFGNGESLEDQSKPGIEHVVSGYFDPEKPFSK